MGLGKVVARKILPSLLAGKRRGLEILAGCVAILLLWILWISIISSGGGTLVLTSGSNAWDVIYEACS